jgi:signal transduction histidine kinase
MSQPLADIAAGNLNARLPAALNPTDEIDMLTDAVNHMIDELKRSAREQQERGEVRQRAIVEERERIARELHDGMAQLLGYVNTKAMAVRLMLKNRQTDAADKHLLQLEEASRALFVDVREAILGLKMSGQNGGGLPDALREYTGQFSRLSSLPVDVKIDPGAEGLSLPAETELQLMRIVQESLTNVRKHASANTAAVSLNLNGQALELKVKDDGVGFEPGRSRGTNWTHYGLSTMRERAEAIGAAFTLESDPGTGTCIIVRLKLERN